MPRPPRLLASALALAGALGPRAAAAAPGEATRTASLGWVRLQGAEGCLGPRALALAVEKRLGRTVFVPPDQADVVIEGSVAPEPALPASPPEPPRFRAHLTLSDASGTVLGTRDIEVQEPGCRALEDPLALVLALLIDPEAEKGPRPPPPAPPARARPREDACPVVTPPAPARPAQTTDDAACAPQARTRTEPWRESLFAGPAVAAGLVPGAGVALSLRGEIVPPSFFPIEIGAAVWLDARGAAASGSAGVSVSLAYGVIGLCPLVWRAAGTQVRGCVELEAGAIRGVGYGFSAANASQGQVMGLGGVAGRVTQRLWGPLEIGVGLGLSVPFDPARFYYVDAMGSQQELFHMAAVAAVADAAVGISFP